MLRKTFIYIVILFGVCMLICGGTGCAAHNVIEADEIKFEISHICDDVWYDLETNIVYIHAYNGMTPYIAPNGLPYKYNPETNTLEEIDISAYLSPEE